VFFVGQVFSHEVAQTKILDQFPRTNQASVTGSSQSQEIDLQGAIERKPKKQVLFLTHWVLTSGASSAR
jgi:hypothetical protein